MINIEGKDKAAVLAALYNRAQPLGMGFLHYTREDMTIEEAKDYLNIGDDHNQMFGSDAIFSNRGTHYFDYLNGRVMKVNLTSDVEFDERLYDRDNGEGAAAEAIASIK